VLSAVSALGLEASQASAIRSFVVQAIARLPAVLAVMDQIDEIVQELQNGLFAIQDPTDLLEKIFKVFQPHLAM
jgi:hypothetical protein